MSVKTLRTKRLILKELTLDHEKDYTEGFVDYEVIRHFTSRIPWPYPENGVRDYMLNEILPNQGQTRWQWGIFLKENPEKLIGSISLQVSEVDNRGFWLARQYWGQGYMTEAAEAVNRFAFEDLGFEILRFTNARGNIGSRRIKEKTGARLVKSIPIEEALDPQYTEAEHWEFTRKEWESWRKKNPNQFHFPLG